MMNEAEKCLFLKEFINDKSVIDELLIYVENKFINNNNSFLFEDAYINTWEEYYRESEKIGVFETLKKYLIQLQFPIQKGISKTEEYINSSLRGKPKLCKSDLMLNQPELIKLEIYKSNIIGKVPVIIVPNDDDFYIIVCALSNKNEPMDYPKSMGASFISGINNWDRINRLKDNWLKNNFIGNWSQEFKENILPKPHLFKDKLIILSTKKYSGVESMSIGVSKNTWKSSSLIIRREHECAHSFTLKHYGCTSNNIHDEIIADYAGITKVLGQFNSEWFLQFIGLENYPNYRRGGRLENYLGQKGLSKEAFDLLKIIVKNAADNISKFDEILGEIKDTIDQLKRIKSICEVDLITMSSSKGIQNLMEKYISL